MTGAERRALVVKFMVLGYKGRTENERMAVAYIVTPGGCHACPR